MAGEPLITRGRLAPDCLAGRVVILTGGGGGIGLEAAKSLLELGACVVVGEADPDLARTAEEELCDLAPDRVAVTEADVSDKDSVDRLVGAARERFGTGRRGAQQRDLRPRRPGRGRVSD